MFCILAFFVLQLRENVKGGGQMCSGPFYFHVTQTVRRCFYCGVMTWSLLVGFAEMGCYINLQERSGGWGLITGAAHSNYKENKQTEL